MPRKRDQAFRKLRRELNRIPNMDLVEPIELGQIAFFDSRKLTFDWRTKLSNLGIFTKKKEITEELPTINELYTSHGAVNFKFSLDETNLGKAIFSFSKEYSLATQAMGMTTIGFEIRKLERDILAAIKSGKVIWDKKWVIVTQIYRSPSFTLLVASSRKSAAEILTSIAIEGKVFNIADSKLGVNISTSNRMAYQIVGKKNVIPFFKIYQFKGSWKEMKIHLKPYGRGKE